MISCNFLSKGFNSFAWWIAGLQGAQDFVGWDDCWMPQRFGQLHSKFVQKKLWSPLLLSFGRADPLDKSRFLLANGLKTPILIDDQMWSVQRKGACQLICLDRVNAWILHGKGKSEVLQATMFCVLFCYIQAMYIDDMLWVILVTCNFRYMYFCLWSAKLLQLRFERLSYESCVPVSNVIYIYIL